VPCAASLIPRCFAQHFTASSKGRTRGSCCVYCRMKSALINALCSRCATSHCVFVKGSTHLMTGTVACSTGSVTQSCLILFMIGFSQSFTSEFTGKHSI
jgi:hypothetical protein